MHASTRFDLGFGAVLLASAFALVQSQIPDEPAGTAGAPSSPAPVNAPLPPAAGGAPPNDANLAGSPSTAGSPEIPEANTATAEPVDNGTPEPLIAGAAAVASYTLNARLDAAQHRVTCQGTIVWHNASQVPANELWFHLYLNAFKNDKTLFLRSPFGAGRSGERAKEWGYVDVKRLTARELDQVDLWKTAAKHSPGDPDDQTDILVPLPTPVEAGSDLTLDIEFEIKLPEIVERTGFSNDFHFVAQWFPKLARREADGNWIHFPFHAQSEFYADYGDYDVSLDVPQEMVVGATGKLVSKKAEKGRVIHRYHAESVHDFAWTAWPGFQEKTERIAGTEVRLLFPKEHVKNAARTFDTLRFVLPHFNRRYGDYPYPTLTVVHPPQGARNAGGMEYPSLITTGGPWYEPWTGVRSVEAVTVHELGHQWFYGLVASDEHAAPFLDEGINSYAEAEALQAMYGKASLADVFDFTIDSNSVARTFAIDRGHDERVATPAAGFESFRNMAALVYSRTATILATFERVYGKKILDHALGAYTRRFRFAHPTPADFSDTIGEFIGSQAKLNLDRALMERGWVDYVVRDLQSAPKATPAGVFDSASGKRETRQAVPHGPSHTFVGRAVVYRHGNLEFPIEIELVAEDGSKSRQRWDGRGENYVVQYQGTSPLVSVIADPEQRVLLDDNLLNNAITSKPAGTLRTFERILYVSELILATLGP